MNIDRPTFENYYMNDWNTIVPTAITAGSSTTCATVVFTGTYVDTLKWNRSLFRCRAAAVAVTCSSSTGLLFDKGSAHGHKDGDIVFISAAVLPTGIEANRPYYMVSTAANTFKLSLTPGGSAIAYTNAGTTVTASFLVHGYVDNATISGTDVTLSVSLDYDLTATVADFTNYQVTRVRKIYDFQEYINTGYVEVVLDASNAQGRMVMDIPRAMYLQSVSSAVGTAAAGAGAACSWNIYSGSGANPTTNLFSSAPDMTTNTILNYQRPTTKYLASATNIAMRVITSAGATNKAAKLQIRMFLLPIDIVAL